MEKSKDIYLKDEKNLFNKLNYKRSLMKSLPIEFDYDHEPKNFDYERYTSKRIGYNVVNKYISIISETSGKKVVDVCCGPGWVSLLAATRGASVSGFDISDVAISCAEESLKRNVQRIKNANGSLEYFNKNAHTIPFLDQNNSVDVFVGWSAFHHLDEMENMFKKMKHALKDGGCVISVDDIGSQKINRIIAWFLKFILPIKGLPYSSKIKNIGFYFKKIIKVEVEWHTPMEAFVGKHSNAAQQIENILNSDYSVIHNIRYCAFLHYFVHDISGPDWFRIIVFEILWAIDRLLVCLGVCKGNLRFMVGKKL